MNETQSHMSDDTTPQKYRFDLTFDNGMNKRPLEKEKPKPMFTQENMDEAHQAGYQEGVQAGREAEAKSQQKQMNLLLSDIGSALGGVMQSSEDVWQRQLNQLQQIALSIAKKILPHYAATHGLDEIEAIVAKVLADMGREPRLVFRVNEESFDEVSDKINAIAASQAYAGKVVILGDPDIAPGDCRIEWADGGIERNTHSLWDSIEKVMTEATGLPIIEEPEPEDEAVAETVAEGADSSLEISPEETELDPLKDLSSEQPQTEAGDEK
ncbi:MAG: FliH/SctL family protein [Bdellovibrionales bacterium]